MEIIVDLASMILEGIVILVTIDHLMLIMKMPEVVTGSVIQVM